MSEPDKVVLSEQQHLERMSANSRIFLKKHYLAVRNIGILLVDIIPYERKNEMIDGLKRLFTPDADSRRFIDDQPRIDKIPDIRQSGMMPGGGEVNIGTIVNSELGPNVLAFQKKLPTQISYIKITLGQFVDFSYYVVYSCIIREEYQNNNIEGVFTESEDSVPFTDKTAMGNEIKGWKFKGPEHEPTIQEFQEIVVRYLQPFSVGLFINGKKSRHGCPSLKVIAVPHIDFDSFEQWEKDHSHLLRFLGFDIVLSQYGKMLVGKYEKPLLSWKPQTISEGLVFLASLDDFKDEAYITPENEIVSNIENLGGYECLTMILASIYWAVYSIEILQQQWKDKSKMLFSDMRNLKKKRSSFLFDYYDAFCESYRSFKEYKIAEDRNIRVTNESINQYGFGRVVRRVKILGRFKLNLFEELVKGTGYFLTLEKTNLEDIKNEFDDLFSYSNDFVNIRLDRSNLSLQRSMTRMTVVMLIFTVVTVAITLVPYYRQMWDILKALIGLG